MSDRETVVVTTVKAFIGSLPDGPKDIQMAFTAACDVSFSLLMSIAATSGLDPDVVLGDFLKAIERREKEYRGGRWREWKGQ